MATKKRSSKKRASKKTSRTTEAVAARPAVPSAAQLKTAQAKLNADPRLRARFLKDPGAVLRQQGIDLGADKEKQLMRYTNELTAPQREVFGAQLLRIKIGISVRIRIIINIGVTL
jgi:hypothetical protein